MRCIIVYVILFKYYKVSIIITNHKELKYHSLRADLTKDFNKIKFVNLSVRCLGIFGNSSESVLQMCSKTGINNHHLNFVISKLANTIIHTT